MYLCICTFWSISAPLMFPIHLLKNDLRKLIKVVQVIIIFYYSKYTVDWLIPLFTLFYTIYQSHLGAFWFIVLYKITPQYFLYADTYIMFPHLRYFDGMRYFVYAYNLLKYNAFFKIIWTLTQSFVILNITLVPHGTCIKKTIPERKHYTRKEKKNLQVWFSGVDILNSSLGNSLLIYYLSWCFLRPRCSR